MKVPVGKPKHAPQEISFSEWREILQMSQVRDGFEIPPNESGEKILSTLFGAKFVLTENDGEIIADLYVIASEVLRLLPVVLLKSHKMMPVDRD